MRLHLHRYLTTATYFFIYVCQQYAFGYSTPPIFNALVELRQNIANAKSNSFGFKARNVVSEMSIGDIVVPLCGNLEQRQYLANRGIYPGVEYEVCSINCCGENLTSVKEMSIEQDLQSVIVTTKPAYKLRKELEREDWPVQINVNEVPLWVAAGTYQAATAMGTLGLAITQLSIAAFLAFFVRFAYVPTESMIPALKPGNVAFVSRSIPIGPLKPKVGDVVFFDASPELKKISDDFNQPLDGQQFLKRVVATPGEKVGVKNSQPFVLVEDDKSNDRPGTTGDGEKRRFRVDIVGPYVKPELFPPSSWDRPVQQLKSDEYFVAGDNGFRSVDSRVWNSLRERYIFGVARWIVWPISDFGPIPKGEIYNIEK